MIEVRLSREEELPAQKELWKTSFGDDSSFIDLFYEHYSACENVLVLLEDGVLRSMAAVLPLELRFPDGAAGKAGYIYALCTHPDSRNKGFIRKLLNYADGYLQRGGKDCMTLVPADASLHLFFKMLGLEECFSHRKAAVDAASLPLPGASDVAAQAEPAEYGRIRETLLRGHFHLSYNDSLLSFQKACSRMFRGDLYRLRIGDTEGCATAEYLRPDRVLIKELMIPQEYAERAVAALSRVIPASIYYLRTPSFCKGLPGSYIQSFGMVKWYDKRLERVWVRERQGYLGLAFD